MLVGRKRKLSISDTDTDIRDVAWQRYEDVLTADVFGAYRYLPPHLGLLPLLQHAVDETGLAFSHYLNRHGIELSSLNIVRLRFWPVFENGREPDLFVLLESTRNQHSVALLVEAKLHAPQHEIGAHSQLGHYQIQHLADGYADGSLSWELPQRPRPLLFITNHNEIPATEIARARREVIGELPDIESDNIGLFWVNWATVGLEARRLWRKHRDEVDSAPWLRHLLDLYEEIQDRDLLPRPPFEGISRPPFTRLPRTYAPTYSSKFREAALPPAISGRRYITIASASLCDGEGRYSRSYQSRAIEFGSLPVLYDPIAKEAHDG